MKKLFMLTLFGLLLAIVMTVCPVIGYCAEGFESTLAKSKQSGDNAMKVSLKAVFHLDLDQEERLIQEEHGEEASAGDRYGIISRTERDEGQSFKIIGNRNGNLFGT